MLGNLIKYEFLKNWKGMRYIVLAYALIEAALLFMDRTFFWDGNVLNFFNRNEKITGELGPAFTITMAIYCIVTLVLAALPFFFSIRRYEKDLSSKQAVLELMIPAPSWMKVTAKLITTVFITIACIVVSIISLFMFFSIMLNFNGEIGKVVSEMFKAIAQNPGKFMLGISEGFFMFASMYLLFFFCIAISKWIANKSRASVWISIGVFVLSTIVMGYLGMKADKFPIVSYTVLGITTSLSSTLVDIFTFAVMFAATSWVMENKIEV